MNRIHPRARGRRTQPIPGAMNKLESAYAQHLEQLRRLGQITSFDFEAIKFKLAPKTFYTPDFLVIDSEGLVELHECKGFWEDDARVKIKVAAERFPAFSFVAVKRNGTKKAGDSWSFEHFGNTSLLESA